MDMEVQNKKIKIKDLNMNLKKNQKENSINRNYRTEFINIRVLEILKLYKLNKKLTNFYRKVESENYKSGT